MNDANPFSHNLFRMRLKPPCSVFGHNLKSVQILFIRICNASRFHHIFDVERTRRCLIRHFFEIIHSAVIHQCKISCLVRFEPLSLFDEKSLLKNSTRFAGPFIFFLCHHFQIHSHSLRFSTTFSFGHIRCNTRRSTIHPLIPSRIKSIIADFDAISVGVGYHGSPPQTRFIQTIQLRSNLQLLPPQCDLRRIMYLWLRRLTALIVLHWLRIHIVSLTNIGQIRQLIIKRKLVVAHIVVFILAHIRSQHRILLLQFHVFQLLL
mmetsp:Transcript_65403/g.104135  ORF Transcript_65403/g.104135 Transcript_65403/m.104135 type:complete len:263 (+) Transcript_65403:361-1149(+)